MRGEERTPRAHTPVLNQNEHLGPTGNAGPRNPDQGERVGSNEPCHSLLYNGA